MEHMFHIQVKNKIFGEDWLKSFATEILDAKYEKTDAVEVMKGLTHLNTHQKADLLWVLQEIEEMFDESLEVYPYKKVHFGIDPNAKSVHPMPYPVPWSHLKTLKKSLTNLLDLVSLHHNKRVNRHHPHWFGECFLVLWKHFFISASAFAKFCT